jgi:hypothetical protein
LLSRAATRIIHTKWYTSIAKMGGRNRGEVYVRLFAFFKYRGYQDGVWLCVTPDYKSIVKSWGTEKDLELIGSRHLLQCWWLKEDWWSRIPFPVGFSLLLCLFVAAVRFAFMVSIRRAIQPVKEREVRDDVMSESARVRVRSESCNWRLQWLLEGSVDVFSNRNQLDSALPWMRMTLLPCSFVCLLLFGDMHPRRFLSQKIFYWPLRNGPAIADGCPDVATSRVSFAIVLQNLNQNGQIL